MSLGPGDRGHHKLRWAVRELVQWRRIVRPLLAVPVPLRASRMVRKLNLAAPGAPKKPGPRPVEHSTAALNRMPIRQCQPPRPTD